MTPLYADNDDLDWEAEHAAPMLSPEVLIGASDTLTNKAEVNGLIDRFPGTILVSRSVDFKAAVLARRTPPSVFLIYLQDNADPEQRAMLEVVQTFRHAFGVDVPVVIRLGAQATMPRGFNASVILGDGIPRLELCKRLAMALRMALRTEEARLRRRVFGFHATDKKRRLGAKSGGLLVIGLGGQFAGFRRACPAHVDIVGALTTDMADEFMQKRNFEAVMIDSPPAQAANEIIRIRSDPRYITLPILATGAEHDEIADLYLAGATDVLSPGLSILEISTRLSCVLGIGRRRRIADKLLSASRARLAAISRSDGLEKSLFQSYHDNLKDACERRGQVLVELNLNEIALEWRAEKALHAVANDKDLIAMLFSIAHTASRDEDMVVNVQKLGLVALLRGSEAAPRLRARILSILRNTGAF